MEMLEKLNHIKTLLNGMDHWSSGMHNEVFKHKDNYIKSLYEIKGFVEDIINDKIEILQPILDQGWSYGYKAPDGEIIFHHGAYATRKEAIEASDNPSEDIKYELDKYLFRLKTRHIAKCVIGRVEQVRLNTHCSFSNRFDIFNIVGIVDFIERKLNLTASRSFAFEWFYNNKDKDLKRLEVNILKAIDDFMEANGYEGYWTFKEEEKDYDNIKM